MDHYCQECGLVLTPTVRIEGGKVYIGFYCADHPRAVQLPAAGERDLEGD